MYRSSGPKGRGSSWVPGPGPGFRAFLDPADSPTRPTEPVRRAGSQAAPRLDFDPCGHYARPDVFRLEVDERERPVASFVQGPGRATESSRGSVGAPLLQQ